MTLIFYCSSYIKKLSRININPVINGFLKNYNKKLFLFVYFIHPIIYIRLGNLYTGNSKQTKKISS